MIKCILLDFDGTLVDSMKMHTKYAVYFIKKYKNMPEWMIRKKYLASAGLPFRYQLDLFFDDEKLKERIYNEYVEKVHAELIKIPPYSDVKDGIEILKRKYTIAVTSGTKQEFLEEYMSRYGLNPDIIMGFRPPEFEKSRHIEYLIEKYGFKRNEIIFVGDSPLDMKRAKEKGIYTVGRITDVFPQEELIKNGADFLIKDLKEILKFISE